MLLVEKVWPDLLHHLRLLPQASAHGAADVHAEIFDHHLINQLLQLTQLRAQMSGEEGDQPLVMSPSFIQGEFRSHLKLWIP